MTHQSAYRDEIESAFFEARKLPVSERGTFLKNACHGNAELLDAVKELLDAESEPDSLLDSPLELSETFSAREWLNARGQPSGDIDCSRNSARAVSGWCTWRNKLPLRRKVALKIIKPGMDSQESSPVSKQNAKLGHDEPSEHGKRSRRRNDRLGPALLRHGTGGWSAPDPVL